MRKLSSCNEADNESKTWHVRNVQSLVERRANLLSIRRGWVSWLEKIFLGVSRFENFHESLLSAHKSKIKKIRALNMTLLELPTACAQWFKRQL